MARETGAERGWMVRVFQAERTGQPSSKANALRQAPIISGAPVSRWVLLFPDPGDGRTGGCDGRRRAGLGPLPLLSAGAAHALWLNLLPDQGPISKYR